MRIREAAIIMEYMRMKFLYHRACSEYVRSRYFDVEIPHLSLMLKGLDPCKNENSHDYSNSTASCEEEH